MKWTLRIFALALMLQSFTCSDNIDNVSAKKQVTEPELSLKKQEILIYINSFSCNNSTGCSSIAFGSKPCGGPREYLVFPTSINMTTLQNMVNEYNRLDNELNIATGAISDCAVVTAPTNGGCVNGVCTIIN